MKGYLSKTLKLADQTILIKTDVPQIDKYIVSRSNILECPDTLQHPTVVEFEVGDEKDQDGNLIVLEAKIIGNFELQKLCTKCEVEKPINGWTIESYCNHEITVCRKCSNKKDPPKPKKKKEDSKIKKKKSAKGGNKTKASSINEIDKRLPFSTTKFYFKDWRINIAPIIKKKSKCKNAKQYWEEKARFFIEDDILQNPLYDPNKRYSGYFVNLNQRYQEGWQGFVWCEEFNDLILVQHGNGDGKGDIGNKGEKIDFQVIVHTDDRGRAQFKAVNWVSSYQRFFDLPAFSVSLSEYNDVKYLIPEFLHKNDLPVVIVDLNKPNESGSTIESIKKELENDFSVYIEDWPKKTKKTIPRYNLESHTKEQVSHPFIAESVKNTLVIRSNNEKIHPLSKKENKSIMLGITKIVHQHQIEERGDAWLILGDETGSLEEFTEERRDKTRKGRMMWIAIPPDISLPRLSPEFHGKDYEQFHVEMNSALEQLALHEDVEKFIFSHEQGQIPSMLKEPKSQSPHLMMWNNTLPLILEYLLPKIADSKVKIYIERVHPLEPGSLPMAASLQDIGTNFEKRTKAKNIEFIDHRILSKNPLEHGWLGYTDALGHIYNDIIPSDTIEYVNRLRNDSISVPYRNDGIAVIRKLISEAAVSPLQFLKGIAGVNTKDQQDYVDSFLNSTISNSISELTSADWQDLLQHIKTTSNSEEGQKASIRILSFVNIRDIMQKLQHDIDKFDLLMSMIGTAGHIGATREGLDCISHIEDLFQNGLEVEPDRLLDFKNLKGGTMNNIFDFEHICETEIPSGALSRSQMHYYGSQANARALRNNPATAKTALANLDKKTLKQLQSDAIDLGIKIPGVGWAKACPPGGKKNDIIEALYNHAPGSDSLSDWEYSWKFESHLRNKTTEEHSIIRREIYKAELLNQNKQSDDALNILQTVSEVNSLSKSFSDLLGDGFFLAALLKSSALSKLDRTKFDQYTTKVPGLLSNYHPSQRIAYWCIRWAHELGILDNPLVEQCIDHMNGLTKIPVFTHDAAGLILACSLLDLESKEIVNNGKEFFDSVIRNSHPSTINWINKHPPNKDDWLAPLNFNYK